jgi:hypothetical protein
MKHKYCRYVKPQLSIVDFKYTLFNKKSKSGSLPQQQIKSKKPTRKNQKPEQIKETVSLLSKSHLSKRKISCSSKRCVIKEDEMSVVFDENPFVIPNANDPAPHHSGNVSLSQANGNHGIHEEENERILPLEAIKILKSTTDSVEKPSINQHKIKQRLLGSSLLKKVSQPVIFDLLNPSSSLLVNSKKTACSQYKGDFILGEKDIHRSTRVVRFKVRGVSEGSFLGVGVYFSLRSRKNVGIPIKSYDEGVYLIRKNESMEFNNIEGVQSTPRPFLIRKNDLLQVRYNSDLNIIVFTNLTANIETSKSLNCCWDDITECFPCVQLYHSSDVIQTMVEDKNNSEFEGGNLQIAELSSIFRRRLTSCIALIETRLVPEKKYKFMITNIFEGIGVGITLKSKIGKYDNIQDLELKKDQFFWNWLKSETDKGRDTNRSTCFIKNADVLTIYLECKEERILVVKCGFFEWRFKDIKILEEDINDIFIFFYLPCSGSAVKILDN